MRSGDAIRILTLGIAFTIALGCSSEADEGRAALGVAEGEITEERIEKGRKAFKKAGCTICHSGDGTGGAFGPDLTDDEWLHCKREVEEIRKLMVKGVAKSEIKNPAFTMAMPPVTDVIKDEDEILAIAQYVWSLGDKEDED